MPRVNPFDTPGYDPTSDVGAASTVGPLSAVPVIRTVDGKGTAKQVADLTARDAIGDPAAARDAVTQYRTEGMTCFVQSTQRTYQLKGGITNAHWVDVTASVNEATESLAPQVITGADAPLGATLANTPILLNLFHNGLRQTEGVGKDFTLSGTTITWLAGSGTAADMSLSDEIIANYTF